MTVIAKVRQLTTLFPEHVDKIDPHSHLGLKMRVIGGHSKTLGTVESLERDSSTGDLKSVIVRHGWLRRNLTSVPAEEVKWVNSDSVVLSLTPSRFKALPRMNGR